MSTQPHPRPTDAELEILRVLWRLGPATVRQVHETLTTGRQTAYTTTLKMLQIMTEKGLVSRDERNRSHLYQAVRSEEHTQRQLVSDLLDRAFGGSATKLVMQALAGGRASADELAAIKALIDERKKDAGGAG